MEKSIEQLDMDQFLTEIRIVDLRSREKHPDEMWWEMKFSYAFKKMLGHLLKWFWAGRGNYNGHGPHHLAKVAWYALHIMEMEKNFMANDDRPHSKNPMSLKFVENVAKTIFDK